MPAVRRLFLMMKTGTAAYLGITTGRFTPGLVNTRWSPSVRMQTKPSASKTSTNRLYETGLSLGMRQRRKRESHPLHADELWRGVLLSFAITRLFQDLFQGPHFFGLFQEQPDGLFEVTYGLGLGATARGDIEFQRMSRKGSPFFENAGSELNFHRCYSLQWKDSTSDE